MKTPHISPEDLMNLTAESAHVHIRTFETHIDDCLRKSSMSQSEAWDAYLCLMHEADSWGLMDDFKRLRSKIDIKKYNPLASKNPHIVMLARMRAGIPEPTIAEN